MSNNGENVSLRASPSRYAAAQQILGMGAMASLYDEEGRPVPAKVYPASCGTTGWVVEPPSSDHAAGAHPKTFTGSSALIQALEYAQRTYGSALYLSR
jgi:hypothetical protein